MNRVSHNNCSMDYTIPKYLKLHTVRLFCAVCSLYVFFWLIVPTFGVIADQITNGVQLSPQLVDVVIVGGGPVGLAAALTLSQPPHNCNVCVIESNTMVNYYDPTKAFVYGVNARGQEFTRLFPRLHDKLKENAVPLLRRGVVIKNSMTVLANPMVPLPKVEITEEALQYSSTQPKDPKVHRNRFLLQRHDFTRIAKEVVEQESINLQKKRSDAHSTDVGRISFFYGNVCVDVLPSSTPSADDRCYGVEVIVKDKTSSQVLKFRCKLAVGADGYKSTVRNCLRHRNVTCLEENKFQLSILWPNIPKAKFQLKRYKSPSTGLRLKALKLPTHFRISNVNDTYIAKYYMLYNFLGVNNGDNDFMTLTSFPVRRDDMVRTGYVVTRPNHILWSLQTGEKVRVYFQNCFPKLNFTSMVSREEWERFAKAEGTRFPYCQYSNGVALSSLDKHSGVVLIGDALHSFPPDIGMGLNSGLQDVIALGEALKFVNLSSPQCDEAKSDASTLGDALRKFENDRLKEAKALVQLCRIANPYQYRQVQLDHKVSYLVWKINFRIRMILNKLSFGLTPPPAIQLVSLRPDLSFKQVMLRELEMKLIKNSTISFTRKQVTALLCSNLGQLGLRDSKNETKSFDIS